MGHAGVCGNERADALASKAPVVGTLGMDKGDILRSIIDRLLQIDTALDESVVMRLQEFGIGRGTSRGICLRGRCRRIKNQLDTGTISIHILRHLLGETEHLCVCPECNEVGS